MKVSPKQTILLCGDVMIPASPYPCAVSLADVTGDGVSSAIIAVNGELRIYCNDSEPSPTFTATGLGTVNTITIGDLMMICRLFLSL